MTHLVADIFSLEEPVDWCYFKATKCLSGHKTHRNSDLSDEFVSSPSYSKFGFSKLCLILKLSDSTN